MSEAALTEWDVKPLSQLAEARRGITYSSAMLKSEEGGLPYINMKSFLKGGGFNVDGTKHYAGTFTQQDIVGERDLLIANTDVTSGDIIGVPALLPEELAAEQVLYSHHVTRLRINGEISVPYLYYLLCLPEYRSQMLRIARGTTVLMLDMPAIKRITIRAPKNKTEQNRIVEILSTLDKTIEKTEALIAKYQQIKAGLMHDLFTRGVTADGKLRPPREQAPELYHETPIGWIPKEWEFSSVESLLERIIDYRGKTPTKTEDGIPLITAKNVRMGYIDPEPREYIAARDYPIWMTRGIPVHSDVVFTTEAPLGNVAQIGTSEKVAFAQRVIILQPGARVFPNFLRLLLMTESFQRSALRLSSGSTALGIKQSEFRKIMVGHPVRLDEQKFISDKLTALENYEAAEADKVEKLREQKLGLMSDLLTEKVRVLQ